ncbi:N-acetylmuramoyl-L-alanine amidase LytC precursor [Clostridium ragsdalei P11]|uniref:N-acetylmuramoyl-L-alanine amidase LytC n=1 Tax=Clostridium ragsdalei P11 TaxID=1353534 RepID=A0A1A6AIE3_9CLOT|nr:cell wall-binding repeat-containing protein [Clostridium ragsdalei]OBR89845.1 N-acetylmuramoyl-L-alanine amidase LytC precursor [Clostridium ragsdalei P11]
MSKKSTKALASATLMSLVLTTALSAGPVKAAQGPVTRVSGGDRYATAAKVATTEWKTSDNVVLVSGEGYADAVSASALAKKLGAPILLTTGTTLNADAQSALDTLKPKNVYVVGGTASVSQSIRDGLKSKYTLTELGGSNRYETNVAVAKQLVKLGVSASDVMVVGGQGFADALSVAPVAAAKGQILLLANNDTSATQGAIDFVKDNKSNVTVVGTTNVISDAIKNAFGSTATRVNGGSSRFDTNLAVLKAFSKDLKTDKLYVANASAATPDNLYADALVASALAGKYTAPLVLVDKDGTSATNSAVSYIKSENAKAIEVIGGTSVVPDSIISEITGTTPTPTNPEVSSISTIGLKQVKVVFGEEVDEDTAEEVSNYKIDGTSLTASDANAVLQDDNKTVLITLVGQKKQNDDLDVTVKKGILSSDKTQTIPELTQTVTFSDTTAPTLDSVSIRGNKKITVKFNEPVNVGGNVNASGVYSKFKINDKNLTSFGLDSSTTVAKDAVKDGSNNYWTNQIDFYFSSSLPTGSNVLKVSDGDVNELEDAAGFPIAETTQNFNVDTLTGAPVINGISAKDDGTVYIDFDRPMDNATATTKSKFKINDKAVSTLSGASIDLKKDDTQVKISGINSLLNKNSNNLYIDNTVKDAYGNKVADDTYKSFTLDEDNTKPTVSSVSALDDTTIRVRFSKDVDALSATNVSNYKLKDNDGTVITDEIAAVGGGSTYQDTNAITIPGKATTYSVSDGDSTDVVDIHVNKKLTDSNYSLTIKNIEDTAKDPNTMEDVTMPLKGSDDVTATVNGTYMVAGNTRKVIVYFNKEMDSSSLTALSNYKYKNGSGDIKTLPSDATITASGDNKSAVVEFPSSYGTSGKSGSNLISALDVMDTLKDTDGKSLDVAYTADIKAVSDNPNTATIDAKSVKVVYDDDNAGDDLTVQFKFNNPIDTLDFTDFRVNGVKPSTGSLNGNVVTLKFNDGDAVVDTEKTDSTFTGKNGTYTPTKIEAVKFQGAKGIKIYTVTTNTKDVAGNAIQAISSGTPVYAYDFSAAPKTIADQWYASSTGHYVDVVFDTAIDTNGIDADNFVFTDANGATLTPTAETVPTGTLNEANTVRFTFANNASSFGVSAKIKVRVKSTASIRTIKDNDDGNAYYKASDDDIAGRTISVDALTGAVK